MGSIPDIVGYISYPMFIEPTITRVPSGFSGYIWLDTKIVLKISHESSIPSTSCASYVWKTVSCCILLEGSEEQVRGWVLRLGVIFLLCLLFALC